MKKLLIAFVCIAGFSFSSQAQDIAPNALGLRLGDSDGFGAEISYQRALGSNNRLELDLGIRDGNNYDGFKLAGLYQWVWNIDGGFNWYAGVGGGLASYDYDRNDYDDDTFVFAAGDIGIEYDFDIPLVLSLDFRPEIGFGDGNNYYDNDDLDFDIALGIRYQF
ncbi:MULTISPECIES: hypothetical protein [Leeuwenhoekiella]|jgi:opacity protein-like surface antigen|uniref:Outer membrane protein beta-barrel domain-containing protein n=1 Tax=Leeuwenhoekiella blandensis (strain CECT 7118 / CCUG 51940 / KCTC 22103 / MED217) TaxID=398720 RepID=A3XJ69_LEEBM|nr:MULTISPECIES: hypothetical protein [Leeuwenhoekiella]EAQ50403.1 hypothetical protein MED217_05207 [Leeuwenhoekiella blandensis MED217]MAO41941.1 hypothetical protein [Leeuwenhoekiella sp.]MBQ51391.1 hypothetical protein [Leeuwenhoekiella sp.]HBT11346.1 hypothetical protein [Leeuwenhoekiella sp.]HCW64452.1 hypothetical protein [Leeuwenhoekiella sp.]|tara:strand:- start:7047 stop:7538 length:492 start_codon:yes stop_codon:yes gene_type:complete